jgi:hypothetical protein
MGKTKFLKIYNLSDECQSFSENLTSWMTILKLQVLIWIQLWTMKIEEIHQRGILHWTVDTIHICGKNICLKKCIGASFYVNILLLFAYRFMLITDCNHGQ